jgi:hypothetical protein
MSKFKMSQFVQVIALILPLIILGCNKEPTNAGSDPVGGGEDPVVTDPDPDPDPEEVVTSARISGSVTLSSSVSGSNKPSVLLQKSAADALKFKSTPDQGKQISNKPSLPTGLESISLMNVGDPVSNAFVYLYDAEHPEWLAPVAQDITTSSGGYEFDSYGCTDNVSVSDCVSDAATNDNAYVDGDPLPQGVYTMLIYKPSTFDPILGVTTDPIVSVLPAFRADDEDFAVEEAEAEVSDASPNVVTMFGLKKNTDGTNTWGSASKQIPANATIQVSFDMAMSRGSVQQISVSNGSAVAGKWSLSPDWLSATFEPTAALTAGTYTVTIPSSTVNVYSNALGYKAVGTFEAVAVDSTAPTVSVTSPTGTTDVPATTPIRISSNEVLDVNSLRIDSTPSIGDFPSVKLVDSDGTNYVYEIIASKSLQLGTSYSLTFSGLKDGSGNAAANLTKTFATQAASAAEGVDDTASAETQNAQVAISEIFAKWVLAVNERNAAAIGSLMSGSFVFEYSVQAEEGFRDEDVNRNGRLSLKEFMSMIEQGMVHWEFCETTVTGDIAGNVELQSATSGNFEFSLSFDSVNQGQDCGDDGGEPLYATVKNVNGLWKLSRMSEGFDHRGTPVGSMDLIEAQLYEVADNAEGESLVKNWTQMSNFAENTTPLTFKFDHINGVESYVFLLANERDPSELGFAFVVSADRLACGDDSDCSAADGDDLQISVPDPFGDNGMPTGAYPVLEIFGFDEDKEWGIDNPGEVFMWEIIGLDSITSLELASIESPNTNDVVNLVRDISAVSTVKRFQNPGEYVELDILVEASGSPLEYNIYDGGFDAGSASQVDITVTSPGDASEMSGHVWVNSNIGFGDYPLTFSYDAGSDTSSATVTVDLFEGWTWIEATNGESLYKGFQVLTTGGKGPDVEVVTIEAFDSTPASIGNLTLDQWQFVDASSDELMTSEGAVTLDVSWSMADGMTASDGVGGTFDLADVVDKLVTDSCSPMSGWANLEVNVWNDSGAYYRVEYCNGGSPSGDIIISTNTITLGSDLEVFQGDNWVSLRFNGDDGSGSWYETQSSFGVYTDAGTTFVPPVTLLSATTSEGTPDENGNWGQGVDLDASDVTVATDEITLVLEFADPNTPMYHAGSDGICCDNGEMTLVSGMQYEVTLTIYNGFNWISIDDGNGNWYNVNIFTENGAEVPKPKFVSANGEGIAEPSDPYAPVQVTVDQCLITVEGTAPENSERLHVNWNGGDGSEGFWEGQEVLLPADTGLEQSWTATFQLISGAGSYNNIDVFDEMNQSGANLQVFTSAVDCEYSEPLLTVDGVRIGSATGTELITDGSNYGIDDMGTPGPVADTAAWVYGTSSIPGRSISIRSHMCGQEVKFGANASTTANMAGTYDWVVQIELFDDSDLTVDYSSVFPFNQWLDVSDGPNYQNISVSSDSNNLLVPAISVDLPGGFTEGMSSGCSYAQWNGGSATEVTITGNTVNPSAADGFGQGYFNGGFVDFTIDANGDFSFTAPLFDGFNMIGVNDGNGGFYDVEIETTNGIFPPQFVFITSHTTTDVDVSGDITIAGDFDDGDMGTDDFAPDSVNAYVSICDEMGCTDMNFESMLTVPNAYASPMVYDPMDPASGFSLDVTVPVGASVYVDVSGCGSSGCHRHSFTFNDGENDDEYFNKPGLVTATGYSRR